MTTTKLREEADILLFDAPPFMVASDASILATRLDGVLLVLAAGETKREHAQIAVDRLRKIKANIVGAVLNNSTLDAPLRGYYR